MRIYLVILSVLFLISCGRESAENSRAIEPQARNIFARSPVSVSPESAGVLLVDSCSSCPGACSTTSTTVVVSGVTQRATYAYVCSLDGMNPAVTAPPISLNPVRPCQSIYFCDEESRRCMQSDFSC
jgi:hypothetical protein